MLPFLDTANLDEIKNGLSGGWVRGITTNPTLMAKEPKSNFLGHIQKIADLCVAAKQEVPLSVEVFAEKPEEMLKQAREFARGIRYHSIVIKIPLFWETLPVIAQLTRDGIKTNVTVGFNAAQGVMAAVAGATYYSLFFHRIKDTGTDAVETVRQTKQLIAGAGTLIICGSIRSVEDVIEASLAGSDVVTAPLKVWQEMATHAKSLEWNNKFLQDFKAWI